MPRRFACLVELEPAVAVSCSARRRCTLTGSYSTSDSSSNTLAEGWDGIRWRIQATVNPSPGGLDVLSAVSCTSPRACTAVGSYQQDHYANMFAIAETWNGARWTSQTISYGSLASVSCYAAGACTAVADGAWAEAPSDG